MALVGQTRAQMEAASAQRMQQFANQMQAMMEARKARQLQEEQIFMQYTYKPALEAHGGDVTALAKINPHIVSQAMSFRMNPKRAQQATDELASGNMTPAGMKAMAGINDVMGGLQYTDENLVKLRDEAVKTKSITGLQQYINSLDPASPAKQEGDILINSWDANNGTFTQGIVSETPDQVQGFRNGRPIKNMGNPISQPNALQQVVETLGSLFQGKQQQQQPQLSRNPYEQIPVLAQGGSPAQLNRYEQATGDDHQLAYVGDQEYVMNKEAVKQFGPLLELLNNAAPNKQAGMAPNAIQGIPVKAPGGNVVGTQASGVVAPPRQTYPTPALPQGNPMMGGNFLNAQGGINTGQEITIHTPIPLIAEYLLKDPSRVSEITEEQMSKVEQYYIEQNEKEEQEFQMNTQSVTTMSDIVNPSGMSQANDALAKQGLTPGGLPITPTETPATGGIIPGMEQAAQALIPQGQGTGALPYSATQKPVEAPDIPPASKAGLSRNPYEINKGEVVADTVETGRQAKAQAGAEKAEAGEELSKQEEDALRSSSTKASKWISTHRDTSRNPVTTDMMESFMNRYYPDGMDILDLLATPEVAEQLRQGKERLDLDKKAEERLQEAYETSIKQFNEEMTYRYDALNQSKELAEFKNNLTTKVNAYAQLNKNRWERAKTIDAELVSFRNRIATDNGWEINSHKVQEAFEAAIAKDSNLMTKVNASLKVLGEAAGMPIQQYTLVEDNERINLWFNMRKFFNPDSPKQGVVDESGNPITSRLQTYDSTIGAQQQTTTPINQVSVESILNSVYNDEF